VKRARGFGILEPVAFGEKSPNSVFEHPRLCPVDRDLNPSTPIEPLRRTPRSVAATVAAGVTSD
jgi:hypothetical protein